MKKVFMCVFVCLFLAVLANAQRTWEPTGNHKCGQLDGIVPAYCERDIGFWCSELYPITYQHDVLGPSDWLEERSSHCCGLPFTYWASIDYCLAAELKDPSRKALLIELANSEGMLVKNCQGVFVPALEVFAAVNETQRPILPSLKQDLVEGRL